MELTTPIDKLITVAASPVAIDEHDRPQNIVLTALLANGAAVKVGNAASQNTELGAGDSIHVYGKPTDFFVSGTASDKVAVLIYG